MALHRVREGEADAIIPLAMNRTLVAALLVLVPATGHAFDLTGHWTGSWKCTIFDDGVKGKDGNKESTLAITQAGTVFGADLDSGLTYSGIAIADARKPDNKGEIGIVHCGSDDDLTQIPYTELGRWKVSVKGAKGKLNGVTLWSDDSQHIATCKYKYKRIDTVDPAVPTACP